MYKIAQLAPIARLIFFDQESTEPGWYVQYAVEGESVTKRLDIEVGADAFGAVVVAAGYLGCRPEQIQVKGAAWPQPLHGLIPA